MKKLMLFIMTNAIVSLMLNLNAQTENTIAAPTAFETKKHIISYDLTKSVNYAPINLNYQRAINSNIAFTTSIGFFNTSKEDNIETGINSYRDFRRTGFLLIDLVDLLVDGNGAEAFEKEYNQKGQYLNLGVRFYKSNGKLIRFYVEPEFSIIRYKADLQTSTLERRFDEEGDRYVDQTLTVKAIQKTLTGGKLNFGLHLLANNGISFDLSSGIGVIENRDEDGINEAKFGPNSIVNGVGIVDLEIKAGYAF